MADRITDPQPPDVIAQLTNLSAALDQVIPAKQPGHNLLLGTWNVRAFDRLTPKWHRAVLAAMAGEVALPVPVDVEPARHPRSDHRVLPLAGVHRRAAPGHVLRQTDVHREQLGHHPPPSPGLESPLPPLLSSSIVRRAPRRPMIARLPRGEHEPRRRGAVVVGLVSRSETYKLLGQPQRRLGSGLDERGRGACGCGEFGAPPAT